MPAIIIYGNAVAGFSFRGPFANETDAVAYAEWTGDDDWLIAELTPPDVGFAAASVSQGEHCQCQNCDWSGPVHDAEPVHDIWSRVAPGETMPAGDCPECGALVHLIAGGENAGDH